MLRESDVATAALTRVLRLSLRVRTQPNSPTDMIQIADIDECVVQEFSSRLEPYGFHLVGKRKWVLSPERPIRHLFIIGATKGGSYAPIRGVSSGIVPIIQAKRFRCQTNERNAVMDLIVDPIDVSGKVPQESFAFLPGLTTVVPKAEIRRCAAHFVPMAIAHFERARNLAGFCSFFLERSRLHYARFAFDVYTRHRIASGFVHILRGEENEGVGLIQRFCDEQGLDQDDRVLQDCIEMARRAA